MLGCSVDSRHVSVSLKKKIKTGEFLCSHFNTEDRRKKPTFSEYYALLFQERLKNATEMQKKKQRMEKAL